MMLPVMVFTFGIPQQEKYRVTEPGAILACGMECAANMLDCSKIHAPGTCRRAMFPCGYYFYYLPASDTGGIIVELAAKMMAKTLPVNNEHSLQTILCRAADLQCVTLPHGMLFDFSWL